MLYLRYYHYDDLISAAHKCLIIILATLIFHDVNFFLSRSIMLYIKRMILKGLTVWHYL